MYWKLQQLCESYKDVPGNMELFKLTWWVECRSSLGTLSQPGAEQKRGISAPQLWALPNSWHLNTSHLAQLCAQGRASTSIPQCRALSITHRPALAARQIWALLMAPVAGNCDLTPEQELWLGKLQLEVESLGVWVQWGFRRTSWAACPWAAAHLFPCLPAAFALLGVITDDEEVTGTRGGITAELSCRQTPGSVLGRALCDLWSSFHLRRSCFLVTGNLNTCGFWPQVCQVTVTFLWRQKNCILYTWHSCYLNEHFFWTFA